MATMLSSKFPLTDDQDPIALVWGGHPGGLSLPGKGCPLVLRGRAEEKPESRFGVKAAPESMASS